MQKSPEQFSPQSIESKEAEIEKPNLTVYLIRHGESSKDKTNPERMLTEQGKTEVNTSFNEIIDQIISDELPDCTEFDDPEKRQQAAQQALQKIELHLTDSGTYRTSEQAWQEYQMLITLGVNPESIVLPKTTMEWALQKGHLDKLPENTGPGIKKRLAGVQGMDKAPDFRKKLDSPKYQKEVGASDTLIAWALTDEDEIPDGVESKKQMETRLNSDLQKVERIADKKLSKHKKRVIYIANSHASIITLSAASEFNVSIEQIGEIDSAEGLRYDFYGNGKAHTTEPFGEKTTAKLASLKS